MVSKRRGFIMTLNFFIIILFFSGLLVGVVPREASCESEDQRVSKLIESARTEGKMVLYTTILVDTAAAMIKRFEEKYPFIKVDLYRAPSQTLISKMINEVKAKKYIPDVIEIPGFGSSVVKKERLYTSYISPENRNIPDGFKDPDGYWTSTHKAPYIIAYNSKILSRKDIPDTYEGLLHPRWKGKKIGFDTKEIEWFANMLKILGEEKGMNYFKKLAAQELAYRTGQTLITQLIIAGELPLGRVFQQSVEDLKRKGAPVDWVGVSPIIARHVTMGLAAHAAHPNAAKLYIDFCLSREGQKVLVNRDLMPTRSDVEADSLKAFKGLKIYPSDTSLADKFTTYTKQSDEVFKLVRSR